jgi:hypothetical protein
MQRSSQTRSGIKKETVIKSHPKPSHPACKVTQEKAAMKADPNIKATRPSPDLDTGWLATAAL